MPTEGRPVKERKPDKLEQEIKKAMEKMRRRAKKNQEPEKAK
jgi:hypothetical protein